MTEEDQLALALQMSMAGADEDEQAMETEEQVSLISLYLPLMLVYSICSPTHAHTYIHKPLTHILPIHTHTG